MSDFFIPGDLPEPEARNGKKREGKLGPASAIYINAIGQAAKVPGQWGKIGREFRKDQEDLVDSIVSRLNNGHLLQNPVPGHPVYIHPKSGKKYLGFKHNVNSVKRHGSDGRPQVWIQVLA